MERKHEQEQLSVTLKLELRKLLAYHAIDYDDKKVGEGCDQMIRRDLIWPVILLALIVIGIVTNPGPLIIPAVLVAIVAFLYFFPPQRWKFWIARMKSNSSHTTRSTHSKASKSSTRKKHHVKLRVIQGNKRDDKDEPPRYH